MFKNEKKPLNYGVLICFYYKINFVITSEVTYFLVYGKKWRLFKWPETFTHFCWAYCTLTNMCDSCTAETTCKLNLVKILLLKNGRRPTLKTLKYIINVILVPKVFFFTCVGNFMRSYVNLYALFFTNKYTFVRPYFD